MNPIFHKMVNLHLKLKKELGSDHPQVVEALKRTVEYQALCLHVFTKPMMRGTGLMCKHCNFPFKKDF